MSTRRSLPRLLAAALGATVLAACGDMRFPTSPDAPLRPQALRAVRPSFDISGTQVPLATSGDTTYATITVSPDRAETFVFDRHSAVVFPAQGICDPATSSYGVAEWDQPCAPASGDVTIHLKRYIGADGQPRVDFEPSLRFNPASEGVFLYMENVGDGASLWWKDILWCSDEGACVDESIADPTLQTYADPATGLLGRRIKHFSGYTLGVGFGGLEAEFSF